MLFIPVEQLRTGMTLARDLPSDFFGLSLVSIGQQLTRKSIARILKLGIPGAYVECTLGDEVNLTVVDVLSPAVQKKLIIGIKKQFDSYSAQSGITAESVECFYQMSSEIVTNVLSKDNVLVNMVNMKRYDDYTYSHSAMVGLIGTLIGTKLGMKSSDLRNLATCGLMHDIGKMDVPIEITNKPDFLTPEEMAIMRQHPTFAVERLRNVRSFNFLVIRGIGCHHEKYDGTGYPNGLTGENIPLYGRILALADVYDALTSKRAYRDSWTSDMAIEYMMGLAGTHFDFNLLNVFLSVVAAYPLGTMVELSNGRSGVVVANTPGMTLRPTIRLLAPPGEQGTVLDLANDHACLNITVVRSVTDFSILPDEVFIKA